MKLTVLMYHKVDVITPTIHEIDRNATRIWFAFWPLDLHLALDRPSRHRLAVRTTLTGY